MRNDSLQYKMCKKPCLTQPDDTQLAKGEKKWFPYCRTWQQHFCAINVPADGKIMVNVEWRGHCRELTVDVSDTQEKLPFD